MTLTNAIRYAAVIALFLLTGCSHRTLVATVIVIDTSASITPRAERAALRAVGDQISHLGRGDLLILIPITGDAQNDAGGRILRLSAPTQRETYDTDLRRFREQGRKQFAAWAASLDPHQSRTDIFGTLAAARQEFALLPNGMNRRLTVVSDFLEDDGTFNFISANQLANPSRARELAARLREQHGFTLQGVPLCLGRLESSDFAPLPAQRKEAVQALWMAYFSAAGVQAEIHFDGTGILADVECGCFGGKQEQIFGQ
jgi:hypothetical protein